MLKYVVVGVVLGVGGISGYSWMLKAKSERVKELKLLRGNHGRRTSNACAQFGHFLRRACTQHSRARWTVYKNATRLFGIGVLLGGLYKHAEDGWAEAPRSAEDFPGKNSHSS